MFLFTLFIFAIIITTSFGSVDPADLYAASVSFSRFGSILNDGEVVQLKQGCTAVSTLRQSCVDSEDSLIPTLSLDAIMVTPLPPFTMAIAYLFESIEDCESWNNPIGGDGIYDTRGNFSAVVSDAQTPVAVAAIRIDASAD